MRMGERFKRAKISRLKGNMAANIVQAICSAGLLFLLYRYINEVLGISALGVWSVVVATASVSQAASFGLGEAVTRFVAMDRKRGGTVNAALVVDTATITIMVITSALIPFLYLVAKWLLSFVFIGMQLHIAIDLLPVSLLSLWITIISSISLGALEGCQRMGVRTTLLLLSQVLLLVLAMLVVPQTGIIGLAWAQVGQSLFLIFASRFALRRFMPHLTYVPSCWSWHTLRAIIGYGVNVQLSSIIMLTFLPVAKAMMARFGGADAAGFFEIANQFVMKVGSIIVSANRAIVPVISEWSVDSMDRLTEFYKKNLRVVTFFAISSSILLLVFAPLVSWLALDGYNSVLTIDIVVISIGWCLSLLGVPSYFINRGTGKVGVNTIGHILVGTISSLLALVLGPIMGGFGVLMAYFTALVIGMWWQFATFRKLYGLSSIEMPYAENKWLFGVLVIATIWFAIALSQNLLARPMVMTITMVGGTSLVIFFGWKHHLIRGVLVNLEYKYRL